MHNKMKRCLSPVLSPVLLLMVVLAAGCGQKKTEPKELILYCGAGIREAANTLIKAFENENPGIKIKATYAGAGRLLGQISALQQGDLFMPGAELYADEAVEKGLAEAGTKKVVSYFVPVLFVAKGNPKSVNGLDDLGKEGLRIGIGDERACAVGKKTLKLLENCTIPYGDIEDNVVFKSGTVNELGVAVQMGNVDVVVIWDANARQFAEYGDTIAIPRDQNIPSMVPIVLLKSSVHVAEAKAFIEFAASGPARQMLSEKGYTVTLDEQGER